MKKLAIFFYLISISLSAFAQDVSRILFSIEEKNGHLTAASEATYALIADRHAETALGETSVEYSPFFQKNVDGISSSELIVSQSLDFPSLWSAKKKSTSAFSEVVELQYQIVRRDVLLEAFQLCVDLNTELKKRDLHNLRMQAADSLQQVFEKRLAQGDATLIDLNRIKMDRMIVKAEKLKNDAAIDGILNDLKKLNGGYDFDSQVLFAPSADLVMSLDERLNANQLLENRVAEADLNLSKKELSVAKNEWLPKLTLGYRRDTELREASNGFLIGVSMPLFSNSHKVRAAKMRRTAAEAEMRDVQAEQEARLNTLYIQSARLREMLDTYDESLMLQTLQLLSHALSAGELTVIDYYNEADKIYSLLMERIDTGNQYCKIVAELKRDNF